MQSICINRNCMTSNGNIPSIIFQRKNSFAEVKVDCFFFFCFFFSDGGVTGV